MFPNKKILAVDIGGSLAKAAFYVPKTDTLFKDARQMEALTE